MKSAIAYLASAIGIAIISACVPVDGQTVKVRDESSFNRDFDACYAALSGLVVRHGDIIDAIRPIYTEVSLDGELGDEWIGERIGGEGGGRTKLVKPGHLIRAIEVVRGEYFGGTQVVHLNVTWSRLKGDNLASRTDKGSRLMGGGNNVSRFKRPAIYQARKGEYISNLSAISTSRSRPFIADIDVEFSPIPDGPWDCKSVGQG